jgi:hypothetical protein
MNRNKALIGLAPGEQLKISEKQLGTFFCGETFSFVLNPRTRRAAERVARWHGCRFQFFPATGCSAFVKRGRVSGGLVSLLESAIQWSEHMISRARLIGHGMKFGRSSGIAAAAG